MERICEYCKAPFIPKRTDALYCSASCRQLAYVSRKTSTKQNLDGIKIIPIETENVNVETVNVNTNKDLVSTTVEQANELTVNDNDPSIIKNEIDVYPSTETATASTTEELSVNNGEKQTSISKPQPKGEEYTEYYSHYLAELNSLVDERNIIGKLFQLRYSNGKEYADWLNIRFKCLIECLLIFSERQEIELDDLKEVCNAFTALIQSRHFEILRLHYPYYNEIIQWRNTIKKICMNEENETVSLKLKKETRQRLIVTRYELANNAPKVPFSKLNFKE